MPKRRQSENFEPGDQVEHVPKHQKSGKKDRLVFELKSQVEASVATYKKAREKTKKEEEKRDKKVFEGLEKAREKYYATEFGLIGDKALTSKLQEITDNVARAYGFKEKIKIVPILSDEVNAFVFRLAKIESGHEDDDGLYAGVEQGKRVFMYSGLIGGLQKFLETRHKKLTEGHLAAVIAHEIGHLAQERGEKIPTRRQEEYDADLTGAEHMGLAGYNPTDMAEVLEFLKSSPGIPFSKTHPAAGSRGAELSSHLHNPDAPIAGLSKKNKEMPEFTIGETRGTKIKRTFAETVSNGKEFSEVLKDLGIAAGDSYSEALTYAIMLERTADYQFALAFAERPEFQHIFLRYLYTVGQEAEKRIQESQAKLTDLRTQIDTIRAGAGTSGISDAQAAKIFDLEEDIARVEKDVSTGYVTAGVRSRMIKAEDNPKILSHVKAGIRPALSTGLGIVTPVADALTADILSSTSIRARSESDTPDALDVLDVVAVHTDAGDPTDWSAVAQEWTRTGSLPPDIAQKVDIAIQLWTTSDKKNNETPCPYDMKSEQGRTDASRDFVARVLLGWVGKKDKSDEALRKRFVDAHVDFVCREVSDPAFAVVKEKIFGLFPSDMPVDDRRKALEFLSNGSVYFQGNSDSAPSGASIPGVMEAYEKMSTDIREVFGIDAKIWLGESWRDDSEVEKKIPNIYHVLRNIIEFPPYHRSLDTDIVEGMIQRLTAAMPERKDYIEQMGALSKDAVPRDMAAATAYYDERVAAGASATELKSIRYTVAKSINITDWQRANEGIEFLLHVYGIPYEQDTYHQAYVDGEQVRTFLQAFLSEGLEETQIAEVLRMFRERHLQTKSIGEYRMVDMVIREIDESVFMRKFQFDEKIFSSDGEVVKQAATLDISVQEYLELLVDIEQVPAEKDVDMLHKTGHIDAGFLKKYYGRVRGNPDEPETLESSGYKQRCSNTAKQTLHLLAIAFLREHKPLLADEIEANPTKYSIDYAFTEEKSIAKIIADVGLPIAQVVAALPESPLLDDILWYYWQKAQFDSKVFEEVSPYFDGWAKKKTKYETMGRNGLSAGELTMVGTQLLGTSTGRESIAAYDRTMSTDRIPHEALYIFADDIHAYLKIMERKYVREPEFFCDPNKAFDAKVTFLDQELPPCGFRDYLVVRNLKMELIKLTGGTADARLLSLTDRITIPEIRGTLAEDAGGRVAFIDTLEFPSLEALEAVGKSTVRVLIDRVLPVLGDETMRIALGRMALACREPSQDPAEELEQIVQYFPRPSLARDDYLKTYCLEHRMELKKIIDMQKLFTHDMVRRGEVGEVKLVGLEVFREALKKMSAKKRSEYLAWFFGLETDPPDEWKCVGGIFGVHFDHLRDNFRRLTATEKKGLFQEFLLRDNGVLDPSDQHGAQLMDDFLGKMYDAKFVTEEAGSDTTLRDIFLLVFRESIPERRHQLFSALYLALEKAEKDGRRLSFAELATLFLEQGGAVTTKLGQVLSEAEDMPFTVEREKMPDDLKQHLGRLRDQVEPFSVTGVAQILVANGLGDIVTHIDPLLSAAGIKQAHMVETPKGTRVAKVRRPNIDKYVEHDLRVLKCVFDYLRERGRPIPVGLIGELRDIMTDEADFEKENANQTLLRERVKERAEGTWQASVPRVDFASEGVMIEEVAPGRPLTRVKESDTALYEDVSKQVGFWLLEDIVDHGVFHADMHDGNVFAEGGARSIALIDCGATGDARAVLPEVRRVFKGLFLKNERVLTDAIVSLSDGDIDEITTEALSHQLKIILRGGEDIERQAGLISFEILNYVKPGPELRYLLKALATGGHHIGKALRPQFPRQLNRAAVQKVGALVKLMFKILAA